MHLVLEWIILRLCWYDFGEYLMEKITVIGDGVFATKFKQMVSYSMASITEIYPDIVSYTDCQERFFTARHNAVRRLQQSTIILLDMDSSRMLSFIRHYQVALQGKIIVDCSQSSSDCSGNSLLIESEHIRYVKLILGDAVFEIGILSGFIMQTALVSASNEALKRVSELFYVVGYRNMHCLEYKIDHSLNPIITQLS